MKNSINLTLKVDATVTIEHDQIELLKDAVTSNSYDIEITLEGQGTHDSYSFRISPKMYISGHSTCHVIQGNKFQIRADLTVCYDSSPPRSIAKAIKEHRATAYLSGFGVGRYGFSIEENYRFFDVGNDISLV